MKPRHYSTGEHAAVRHGDCVEGLKALAPRTVDLIVTSPPYPGMGMSYGDRYSETDYVEFSRAWLTEAARVLTDTGSIWINVGYMKRKDGTRVPLPYLLWPIIESLGLVLQEEIVWAKPNRGTPASTRFTSRSERWLFVTKAAKGHTFNLDAVRLDPSENRSKDKRNNPKGANPADVWEFGVVNGNAKDRPKHPCPFPVPMIERIVLACSNPGDLVCDPFSGSGSTGVAALRHGRRYIGFEQLAEYVVDAANRLLAEQAREIERLTAQISELQQPRPRTLPERGAPIETAISKARSWNEAARLASLSVNGKTIQRLRLEAARKQLRTDHFTSKPGRVPSGHVGAGSLQ